MIITYGNPIHVFTGTNRHQRRKDDKMARLGLREMPGTQWSMDRARHQAHLVERRRR